LTFGDRKKTRGTMARLSTGSGWALAGQAVCVMGQTGDMVCLRYENAPDFYECLFAPGIKERLQAFK
jgi:hypothetical protein